ncbi:MAG TPA: sigma 54-interacting transcriptional regulator, partial [Longimicrobiales bacterium]
RAAAAAAVTGAPVLISGESGTGKELLARIIHEQSARSAGLFVPVTCGVLDDAVMAAELFGSAPAGPIAGPVLGQLHRTASGTLFLDEVSQLSDTLQARLARALHERSFAAIGSFEARPLESRLIASTAVDFRDRGAQHRFRSELLYQFGVQIDLPSLRRRSEDIPVLAAYFLEEMAGRHGRQVTGYTADVLELLRKYDWPGNVRELRNVIERAVLLARGPTVTAEDLPTEVLGSPTPLHEQGPDRISLAAIERRHIRQVWRMTEGHLGETAELLGIHRNTLRRKMEQYGITNDDARIE